jgi:hypothetical protein
MDPQIKALNAQIKALNRQIKSNFSQIDLISCDYAVAEGA